MTMRIRKRQFFSRFTHFAGCSIGELNYWRKPYRRLLTRKGVGC